MRPDLLMKLGALGWTATEVADHVILRKPGEDADHATAVILSGRRTVVLSTTIGTLTPGVHMVGPVLREMVATTETPTVGAAIPIPRIRLGDYDLAAFKTSVRTDPVSVGTSETVAAGKSPSPAATHAPLPHGADDLIALGWKVEPDGDGLKVTDPTEAEMYLCRSEINRGALTWLSIGAGRQSWAKP